VVLDKSEYKDKLNSLLKSWVYDLSRDPAATVERKLYRNFCKNMENVCSFI
jgi:hypothetical protein